MKQDCLNKTILRERKETDTSCELIKNIEGGYMNHIKIFENAEFGQVRTVMIDGEPWFVGKDVAVALGYEKPSDTVRKHVDKEDRGISEMETHSGIQKTTIINESGLYSLILRSKLESAKKFKRWVTAEVLPTIRKTGTFETKINSVEIQIGEVASYLKAMDRVANRQNLAPYKIAENFKKVSEQFGIQLTADFVKVPDYEQMHLSLGAESGVKEVV